ADRDEHAERAQRDRRVAEVVIGDETDERDRDRSRELGRIDHGRFSFYLGIHASLRRRVTRSAELTASRGWQARRVSNPQPAVLETAALPIELLAFRSRQTC